MSISRLAAGLGAAALAAAMALPVTANAASQQMAGSTDISAARHYRHHHYSWRHYPRHYGWYHYRWGYPRYGYYRPYRPYYWGPHAYVSLPFVSFGIW